MRTLVTQLYKSKMARAGLCFALLVAVVASIAWSSPPEPRLKGTWVGSFEGITWTSTYAPDALGQSAVLTLQWITMNEQFEGLMGSIGAESMSIVSGSMHMVSGNRATGKLIWYLFAPGTASATAPVAGQVKAIAVMTSDWHFTSRTTAEGTHNLKMYFPNAQGSLLPEDGTLFLDMDYDKVPHQKVN